MVVPLAGIPCDLHTGSGFLSTDITVPARRSISPNIRAKITHPHIFLLCLRNQQKNVQDTISACVTGFLRTYVLEEHGAPVPRECRPQIRTRRPWRNGEEHRSKTWRSRTNVHRLTPIRTEHDTSTQLASSAVPRATARPRWSVTRHSCHHRRWARPRMWRRSYFGLRRAQPEVHLCRPRHDGLRACRRRSACRWRIATGCHDIAGEARSVNIQRWSTSDA